MMQFLLRYLVSGLALGNLVRCQECSASKPCETGCCSKWGNCGLGPDYCAKDACVASCDSKAECNPKHWPKQYVEAENCPLNVCCSKYGFCGTTKEFCGNEIVKRPHCSPHRDDNTFSRVVGYYENWAVDRPCDVIVPENIPMSVYSHINFAFATIDPHTFKVTPDARADQDLYRRMRLMKQADPHLSLVVALGGWSFSYLGAATHTTFSDIARASEEKQGDFIRSLIVFMITFGFDGVDIDWEYPAVKSRGGRPEDFKNYPEFLARVKHGLKAFGSHKELSVTLPASYWYLRHFDIKKMANSVDFFNVMTYDLHGTWDKGDKWIGPYLNAHTNLTEIKDIFDLLWRNNIDPQQVSMGLAYYGRTFMPSDPNCLHPGCKYSSGGDALRCSDATGVALNSELVQIMQTKNDSASNPTLYKDAAVKVMTWGDHDDKQWVAYDDGETFQLKADFARSECMGGVFVWAISHDTRDGHFAKALARAAPRAAGALADHDGSGRPSGNVTVTTHHPQCKWTNCDENCPSGWVRMMRKDSGASDGEFMVDETSCDGVGDLAIHQLCCPPDEPLPTCGWYTHNNGECDPTCPDGTIEVGSNSMYCSNGGYQAACCTTDTPSMALYRKCDWTQAPMCDVGHCFAEETNLALSATGSGGVVCNMRGFNLDKGVLGYQQRSYCCDTHDKNSRWDDCEWYDNVGFGPSDDDDFCRSGCPANKVRVAMEHYDGCYSGGRARCCTPRSVTKTEKYSHEIQLMHRALEAWMHKPFCQHEPAFNPYITGGGAGQEGAGIGGRPSLNLETDSNSDSDSQAPLHIDVPVPDEDGQANTDPAADVEIPLEGSLENEALVSHMIQILFTDWEAPPEAMVEVWNNTVTPQYRHLSYAGLEHYLVHHEAAWLDRFGSTQLPIQITCNMAEWNQRVAAGGGVVCGISCVCRYPSCCLSPPGSGRDCLDPEGWDQEGGQDLASMNMDQSAMGGDQLLSAMSENSSAVDGFGPVKRYPRDDMRWEAHEPGPNGQFYEGSYGPADHWTSGQYARRFPNHPIWGSCFDIPQGDCTNTWVTTTNLQGHPNAEGYHVEHYIELTAIPKFTQAAIDGTIPGVPPIPGSFFENTLQEHLPRVNGQLPPTAGGIDMPIPEDRIMNALGSKLNERNFMMLRAMPNSFKGWFWNEAWNDRETYKNEMEWLIDNLENFHPTLGYDNDYFLSMRAALIAVSYMNDASAQLKGFRILKDLRWEWKQAEDLHVRLGNPAVRVLDAWDIWIREHLRGTVQRANAWVVRWADVAIQRFRGSSNPRHQDIVCLAEDMKQRANQVFQSQLLPSGPPPPPNTY